MIPCVKPQNPNTTNITLSEATLNWDIVSGAWGYRIRYKENSGSSWSFDTTNTNSITITGLNFNTVHRCIGKNNMCTLGRIRLIGHQHSYSKQLVVIVYL